MSFYRFMILTAIVVASVSITMAADGLDDVLMLDKRAGRVVTVPNNENDVGLFNSTNSGSGTEMGNSTDESDNKSTTPGSDFKVEETNSPDGRGGWQAIYVGEKNVQNLPPNCLDSGSIKTWKNSKGEVIAVTYRDKLNAAYRGNGYLTDIPQEASIQKVLDEGDKVRIVWKKKDGSLASCVVPSLSRINKPISWKDSSIETSSPYSGDDGKGDDDKGGDDDDDDGEGGSSDNGEEGSATGRGDDDDDDDDDDDSGSTFNEPEPEREALPDPPDNSFGVHPWLDDATVKAIVEEEIAKAQGAYTGPNGTQLNQWGAVVGTNNNTIISQTGGIDGYPTHVHYWVASNPAVRARLEKEGATLKSQIVEEHEKRYNEQYSAWLSRGGGSSSNTVAVSNERPSDRSNVSAGSSVPPVNEIESGSNFMSN